MTIQHVACQLMYASSTVKQLSSPRALESSCRPCIRTVYTIAIFASNGIDVISMLLVVMSPAFAVTSRNVLIYLVIDYIDTSSAQPISCMPSSELHRLHLLTFNEWT